MSLLVVFKKRFQGSMKDVTGGWTATVKNAGTVEKVGGVSGRVIFWSKGEQSDFRSHFNWMEGEVCDAERDWQYGYIVLDSIWMDYAHTHVAVGLYTS